MINFKLDPINFNKVGTECEVIKINNLNIPQFYQLAQDSIDNFNKEIKWDDMFDFNEVCDRLNNGMVLYIGIYDSNVFGHVWFKDHKDGKFLFNLFVKNKVINKQYSGKEFISNIIHRFEYDTTIYCEVDDWNEKSIKLFNILGFNITNN